MAATPITSLRVVRYRALDLTLLATVYRLVEDVEYGRLDLPDASAALDDAVKAVHPYPRWVATAGNAALAGALALLLGAPWVAVPVAVVITAVIDNVTAAGRIAEIALASAGLLSGVVLGLKVAQRAGVQLDVAAAPPSDATQIAVTLLASAVAAAFYAVGGYAAPLALLFAALAGAAGRGMFLLLTTVGLGPVAASGGAAVVVGAAAGLLRRKGASPSGACRRW
jgi:hypothetical protein